MYDVSVYISEAEVAAFVAESELFVVHTEEVEDGRVKVVHVDLVLDRVLSELVSRAIDEAGFYAPSGQPNRKSSWIVVTA